MRRFLLLIGIAAIVVAYLAGYRPEHRARVAAEDELASTRAKLEEAQARNRLHDLQAQLAGLLATVEAKNYGDAQVRATAFFDAVRAESARRDQAQAAPALSEILAGRDAFTAAVAKADASALELLRGYSARLRTALGQPSLQNPAPAAR